MDGTCLDDDSAAWAEPKFPLGEIVTTPGALDALAGDDVILALRRHQRGDWGDLDRDDRRENDVSLEKGFRLLSAYHDRAGIKFWIITEHDRSVTTILLPHEY